MAKRKRLTPMGPQDGSAPEVKSLVSTPGPTLGPTLGPTRAPIADVAGEASATAALRELSDEVTRAREEGRLVLSLPLDAIVADHLMRDRILSDDAEMAALKASIAARGQQVPIEAVALRDDTYGLISGWRRLTALKALHEETGEAQFGQIQTLLRRPEASSDAYLAMVEENEIRVGLSYYERARIAAKSASLGVFETPRKAIAALFAAGSRAKRSKIASFLTIYEALDDHLAFPQAIPERLGLSVAKALDDGGAAHIISALSQARSTIAENELAALKAALAPPQDRGKDPDPAGNAQEELAPGIHMRRRGRALILSGAGVTDGFEAVLRTWIADQGR